MGARRRLADSPRFWLLVAAVLVADAAVTAALVGEWARPYAVSILGFAFVAIVNGLRLVPKEPTRLDHE